MRFPALLAALAAVQTVAGCAAYRTMPIDPAYRADCFLSCKNQSGLFLASEALFEAGKSIRYLSADMKAAGIIPIVLYASNRGKNSFSLLRDEVTLILPDGAELKPIDIAQTFAEADMEIQIDYISKDFFRGRKGTRIGQDANLAGVIFFRISPGRFVSGLTDAVLNLEMTLEKGEGQAESSKMKIIVAIE